MRDKIKHFFRKTPGERMPNNLGWLVIAVTDLIVIAFVVIGISYCSGCATSSITRRTPMGDVTARSESYVGGLVSSYSEEFDSDGDYERCIEIQSGLMALYRTGRVLNWAEFTPIQQTCFSQTAGFCMPDWRIDGIPSSVSFGPAATMCGGGTGGYGAMGYGFAWSSPPLSITPGLR
jgi:hypothetical protein